MYIVDTLLQEAEVLADTGGTGGLYPTPSYVREIFPYRGDTAILVDPGTPSFVAIDARTRKSVAISHPRSSDFYATGGLNAGVPGFDPNGRFIYRSLAPSRTQQDRTGPKVRTRDTIAIVRADLEARTIDTIAHFEVGHLPGAQLTKDSVTGKRAVTLTLNPYPFGDDDFAVLSDGTLGIVRSADYHVDWVTPDGRQRSSGKLPFDWKSVSDEEKIARVDSARRAVEASRNSDRPVGLFTYLGPPRSPVPPDSVWATIHYVSLSEMPSYVPPIRSGYLTADREGRLWVLPTTSTASTEGLRYDVLSPRDGLSERVMLPKDCLAIGHGRAGVVVMACSENSKWRLVRARIAR
ncbi:MAG: hypothetical protein ACO1Q7_16820 [Gemmatimonas sp.]